MSAFINIGDKFVWPMGSYELTGCIKPDKRSEPGNTYSAENIARWHAGEWSFGEIDIAIWKDGNLLDDKAAVLWRIECGINTRGQDHLLNSVTSVFKEILK